MREISRPPAVTMVFCLSSRMFPQVSACVLRTAFPRRRSTARIRGTILYALSELLKEEGFGAAAVKSLQEAFHGNLTVQSID